MAALTVAVLKREDMEVYQEAQQLSQGQKPNSRRIRSSAEIFPKD
jgi:hypothetical protein